MRYRAVLYALIVASAPASGQAPRPQVAAADYARGEGQLGANTIPLVFGATVRPSWLADGRWLAYTSDLTGRNEVYVSPFPNVDSTRVRVSTDGGFSPLWAHSGSELFFVDALRGSLTAAQVETASGFRVLQRETLFALGEGSVGTGLLATPGADLYDIAPDDQRFLMLRLALEPTSGAGETKFILVQNFFEELKRLVPN